jgi:hypothetical protein
MIDSIFVLPLITTALFYLGARAQITSFLWSRYPARLDALMSCAACSGFWYGLGTAAIGYAFDVPFLGSTSPWAILIAGAMSIVWTAVIAAKMERALTELSGAPYVQNVEVGYTTTTSDLPLPPPMDNVLAINKESKP